MVGEELMLEAPAIGDAASTLAATQGPATEEPPATQPVAASFEDALPVQPVAEAAAETDTAPAVGGIVEEASVVEDQSTSQSTAETLAAEANTSLETVAILFEDSGLQ